MRKLIGVFVLLGFVGLLIAIAPGKASADVCIQFSGGSCDLSGDLGFFRFKGKLPKGKGWRKITALHGRACGVGAAFGTAVVNTEGTGIAVAATFFCDAEQGQFDVSLPVGARVGDTGFGYASYGAYGLGSSCDAEIVDCSLEP
jgi:hypothetical protein